MGCFACQTFWTAVAIHALTRGVTNLAGCLFSGTAYSGAAVLVSILYTSAQSKASIAGGSRPPCRNCGK